jgi:hypothetical protein
MIVGDVQLKTPPCGRFTYFKAELPLMPKENIAVSSVHGTDQNIACKTVVDYVRAKTNDEIVFYDVENDAYIVFAEGKNEPDVQTSEEYHG